MGKQESDFKRCPMCNRRWLTRSHFLDDSTLQLNGYQANFETADKGLFLFTHHIDGCYSTIATFAADFSDLYTGKRYTEKKTGSDECPGYCLKKNKLDRCEAKCEYAFVRELIQIIRKHKSG